MLPLTANFKWLCTLWIQTSLKTEDGTKYTHLQTVQGLAAERSRRRFHEAAPGGNKLQEKEVYVNYGTSDKYKFLKLSLVF